MDNQNRMSKVKAALERSKKLITLESNGSIDKIAKTKQADINLSLDPTANITSESMVSTKRNNMMAMPSQGTMMNSNVPAAIRESFASNPIDDTALYGALSNDGRDLSVLFGEQKVQQSQNVSPNEIRNIVNEGLGNNAQTVTQTSQIDYPMIRTIVEDIVRKYTVSLKQKLLTEGKGQENVIDTIVLNKGFKFLDSKGNIYECTMKKVSNINEIKKKQSIE